MPGQCSTVWVVAFSVALGVAGGCTVRPKAPALRDEPVYQNDREGLRFLVPEGGWYIQGKGELPPGKLPQECLLVDYRRLDSDKQALFEVTAADLPESADLAAQAVEPSFGVGRWQLDSPRESLEVGGVAAVRYVCTGPLDSVEMTKEVVAFRRGERVYFFTGMFQSDDATAREQIRKAIGSTIWKR